MKRRGFVKGLLVSPAISLIAQHPPGPPSTPNPSPEREPPRLPGTPDKLAITQVDAAAQTTQRFFKPEEFAALEKLGEILVPSLKGKPSATDAHAALFLDFLLSQSPHDQQQLYRQGLNGLNTSAQRSFHKSFSQLDNAQADTLLKPLLVARPWERTMPADPMQHFIAQAHLDLRTATANSREWAETSTAPGARHGFNRAIGLYWNPIDPVIKS